MPEVLIHPALAPQLVLTELTTAVQLGSMTSDPVAKAEVA
jgi:hypothetical protein